MMWSKVICFPVRVVWSSILRSGLANALEAAEQLAERNSERRALTTVATSGRAVSGALLRLSRAESVKLLRSQSVGRFAYRDRVDALSVVPVNFVVTDDDLVIFRSGPGPKLASAERGDVVAFEVDDIDSERRVGWSVLVVGRARRLTPQERDALTVQPVPWSSGPREHVVAITPTRIEGRRLY